MKAVQNLPENYKEILSVNLEKNKKLLWGVNIAAVVICVAMLLPATFFIVPLGTMFDPGQGIASMLIKIAATMGLLVIYIILHELVHGIAMKICGTKKVRYGFKGLYAFAGSDDYYDKKSYIFIALAPVVLWGVVLAVVNVLVPEDWFWIIYIVQMQNISGAVGDYYVSLKFSRLPKDILIKDYGVGMTVYSAAQSENC
ncbi:MAG: DUF3267 domain-containing protein [Ruminococcaceae bacterium]|nr:DUF3267 domain-containing protein [Oscillospiraceae bacterium]